MFRKLLATFGKTALFLIVFLLLVTFFWQGAPQQSAMAQSDGTAVPPITVDEPALTPPIGSGQFPNGWLKVDGGKSAFTVYLTANEAEGTGIGGGWQPAFPQAGRYLVEVYVGVSEFRELAVLSPDQLAGLEQITHSAQYVVNFAGGETTIIIDQDLRGSGWVELGEFDFSGSGGEGVTLGNVTDEAAGTAVLALSSARFTRVGESGVVTETAVPPTETPLPPTETPTATATATAVPPIETPTPASITSDEPLELFAFGSPEFSSGDSGEYEEVNIPLIIDGEPVGRMTISYPPNLDATKADNIKANILVEDEFADALKIALEDETQNERLGSVIVRSQFFLSLEAASFDYDDTFETQRLTVFQGQPSGVAWNITPKEGIRGRQEFNIKVILRFVDGIPEVSGPPQFFSINVLSATTPDENVTPTPISGRGGRIIDNLIDNTAVLVGACLSFIVGIAGVIIAYLNYRRGKDSPPPIAPAILESGRQLRLHGWLDDYYNDQELRSLCLEIGVDYDDLAFSGQSAKARELVGWCARNGRLDDLETIIHKNRPNLPQDEPDTLE